MNEYVYIRPDISPRILFGRPAILWRCWCGLAYANHVVWKNIDMMVMSWSCVSFHFWIQELGLLAEYAESFRMNPYDTMDRSNQRGHSWPQDVLSSKTRSSWVHTEKQRGKKQRAILSCPVWAGCAENCEPFLRSFLSSFIFFNLKILKSFVEVSWFSLRNHEKPERVKEFRGRSPRISISWGSKRRAPCGPKPDVPRPRRGAAQREGNWKVERKKRRNEEGDKDAHTHTQSSRFHVLWKLSKSLLNWSLVERARGTVRSWT